MMKQSSVPMVHTRYVPVQEHGSFEPQQSFEPNRRPILGWIWEILSLLACFGCLAAVVVILVMMKDQPLSKWTFIMSINATVALFITASKAAAMFSVGACLAQSKWFHLAKSPKKLRDLDLFEEASRGPMGALGLLYLTGFKIGFAVAIGALATLLALGVDTFGQLVVDVSGTRPVEVNDGKASFGYTHMYDSGVLTQATNGGLTVETSTIDTSMQGAIYKALYNVSTQPVFNCPSQCVWPDSYISLGFAADCADVTAETQATRVEIDENGPIWYNMTTPGNISIHVGYSQTSFLTLAQVEALDLLKAVEKGMPYTEPTSISSEFVRVALVNATIDNVNSADVGIYPDGWNVYECSIRVAAYNYSDISTSGNDFIGVPIAIPLTSGTILGTELTFNKSGLPSLTVQGRDLKAINNLFTSDRFSGTTYSGESYPDDDTGMSAVLRKADLSKLFDGLATSMTDQLRSGFNLTAEGLTVQTETYVRINWQWMSLPFVVLAAALVLLLSTIVRSFDRRPLWKSSVTAFLYHDVTFNGGPAAVLQSKVQSVKELEKLTKRTKGAVSSY
ncbi:hypothetical protein PFICI_10141 [Pestalotiopsis fici W106-1]|uniref:Uncharacterized protein n=1 Tax=Pestalotiopsis fici (strain W106-1 / CGMCC3.15140) TaxID=1229662 RepID=W3WW92_PESFW|nr:uncharacterized protein PFICI_10141 [Pestalotiopsis fici W106-1]ETS78079.1 hypothetical protein PFICI_10141 [Pestalotiopsis fici W106-1]